MGCEKRENIFGNFKLCKLIVFFCWGKKYCKDPDNLGVLQSNEIE